MKDEKHQAMTMAVGMVRVHMTALQVAPEDQEDLSQQVLLVAWQAMKEGTFRAYPNVPLERALDAWLYGISWRQVSHYRERAYRRYEVTVAEPEACRASPALVEPLPVLEARSALRCVARQIATGAVDFQLLITDPGDCEPACLTEVATARGLCSRTLVGSRSIERMLLRDCLDYERMPIPCTKRGAHPNPLEWNPHVSETEPADGSVPVTSSCGSRTPELVDSGASGVSCSPTIPGSSCVGRWRASG